jgi:cytochrome c-type biogenesis protein CcmH/NrfF
MSIPVLCALWSGRAYAQSPGAHTRSSLPDASGPDLSAAAVPPAELEHRPRSDFENSLMGELGCTCGTCGLEPINTCGCDFAAKMRGEVLAELDTHDVSTETGRRAAAESVRASFVARYGAKVIRHRPNADVPVAVGVGVVIVAVIGVRTIRRRRRRGGVVGSSEERAEAGERGRGSAD